MSDPISRSDAIKAKPEYRNEDMLDKEKSTYNKGWNDCNDAWVAIIKALPSAEAVSMEEHIKELNDLAVEWKAKFAKAEKITDEIYDETMAKVAKECEECKERLRNIRQSAEAVQGDAISKRFISDAILQKISELNAQGEKAIPIAREFIRFKRFVDGLTPIRTDAGQGDGIPIELKKRYPHSRDEDITDAFMRGYQAYGEAVQGEWVRKYDDKVNCYWYECDQCGEYRPRNQFGHEYNANFCPNCGAIMKGGEDECV